MVQRKFAEGFRPQSPLSSYCKVVGNSTPRQVQVLPQKAKTEDFLSFLCLRGKKLFYNIHSKLNSSSYHLFPL